MSETIKFQGQYLSPEELEFSEMETREVQLEYSLERRIIDLEKKLEALEKTMDILLIKLACSS